jgi:heat shock transcription factor, other eukaryote
VSHLFITEISRLRYEKSLLLADLQRQNQQQRGISWQMQSLESRLAQMEERQRSVVASLCDILRRRGVVRVPASALETTDHSSKKRRVPIPKIDLFVAGEQPKVEEQQVLPFLQAVGAEAPGPGVSPIRVLDAEPFEKMELALVSLEDFFQRAATHAPALDMCTGGAAADDDESSPPLTLGEMLSVPAPVDTDIDLQLQSSACQNPFASTSGRDKSSSPLAEPPSYAQSPMLLPMAQPHGYDYREAQVDMSSDTTTDDTSQDETTSETGGSHGPAKVNDVFWERFLTDAEGKSEAIEAKEDVKAAVDRSCLRLHDNVDRITEQMGQLDSAENDSYAIQNC